MSELYNSIIEELSDRCENLRMALINFEEVKQIEKHRLVEELDRKDTTISDLLNRLSCLERSQTEKAKEHFAYPDLTL